MKKISIVFLLVIGIVWGIVFSSIGQKSVFLPLANLYLEYAVPRHQVLLTELEPGWHSLRLAGTLDRTIRFEARGPVQWTQMLLNLKYRIDGKEVVLEKRRYPVDLTLRGALRGTPAKLQVTGGGEAFAAKLDYRFLLEKSELRGIYVRADGAQVDQLLALAGKRPYARGRLNLQIDMPRLDTDNPEGQARFTVSEGKIDAPALKKDFGIDLPAVKKYRLEGTFRLEQRLVKGEALLKSPLMDLSLKHFRSDVGFRIFKSRYALEIPELSRLKKLTKTPLYGPWKMGGEFYFDRKDRKLQLSGTSPSLEGKSFFFYDNGRMTLDFKKAGIPQLLALLGQKPLVAKGSFDAHADLENPKKIKGAYRIDAKGSWDWAEMAKLAGTDPGTMLDFTFQSDGQIAKGVLDARVKYRNALFDLEFSPLRYALEGGAFEGKYRLKMPDLARVAALKRQGVRGALDFSGQASYLPVKKLLKVEGRSASLGGETRFVYAGPRLNLTLKSVDGARLLRLLGVPAVLNASEVNGVFKFSDISRRVGSFTLGVKGKVDRTAVRKAWGIDPGPRVTLRLKGKGKVRGEEMDSQWHLESSLGQMTLEKCRLRLDTGACQGVYHLKIPELKRLRTLTDRTYHGPLAVAGHLAWEKKLKLDGSGKEWGGRIDYRLEGSLLRMKSTAIQARELMKMMGYTPLVEGTLSSDLRLNVETEKGTFQAELTQAHFLRSSLTTVASRVLHFDIAKELFSRVRFSSRIDGPWIIFNLNARSQRLLLSIQGGKIDRKKGTIDAVLSIEDRGRRYRLKLRGPLDRPLVVPLMTRDLVKKAERALKKHKIDKVIPTELQESGNPVGDFIKKLF